MKFFSKFEKPAQFDIRTLFKEKSDETISEELADYFNKVSKEFDPLEPKEIPAKRPRGGRVLACYEVAARCASLNPWYQVISTRNLSPNLRTFWQFH